VRINIQLIDAQDDDLIVSIQYNWNLDEIFILQGEIASEIVDELSIVLSDNEKTEILQNQTNNLQAFSYYQIGRHHLCRCSKEEAFKSIEFYKKALLVDSNYALAYAGLAEAYRIMYSDGFVERKREVRDTAFFYAKKLLELDENNAEAHTVLATVYFLIDNNIEAAENEFNKSHKINTNNSLTYKEYARFLGCIGKHKKAREYMNKAIIIDPFSFAIRFNSTCLYLKERNYVKAFEEMNISNDIVKDHRYSFDTYFFIYVGLGNDKAALDIFKRGVNYIGKYTEEQADSSFEAFGVSGLLRLKAETTSLFHIKAQCYAMLGEKEKAIQILETALTENRLNAMHLIHIDTKNFETDPRLL